MYQGTKYLVGFSVSISEDEGGEDDSMAEVAPPGCSETSQGCKHQLKDWRFRCSFYCRLRGPDRILAKVYLAQQALTLSRLGRSMAETSPTSEASSAGIFVQRLHSRSEMKVP
eukprot:scaffold154992_cov20-Prasinocladus_malaysianus.AAC.1